MNALCAHRSSARDRHVSTRVAALCAALAGALSPAPCGALVDAISADGFECDVPTYSEPFTLADGAPWPAPWSAPSAGAVGAADIQGGQARLRPQASSYSLGRMVAPVHTHDVEVTFAFRIEDEPTQGVGFYVRSNGGYLTQTVPNGQGYAVFIEGSFRGQPGIGVWKELNGVESMLNHSVGVAGPQINSLYRVRLRVTQTNPTTTLVQARFWIDGTSEPALWQSSASDATAVLQNVHGGIAVDSWSVRTSNITAYTEVDEIVLTAPCP